MHTIGVVGGAGPMAGVQLLEQIFAHCQTKYHCSRDHDFPKVVLISYPFSEILIGEFDPAQIKKELSYCLNDLRAQGATLLAIACNTLHLFLDDPIPSDFVHLPKLVKKELRGQVPLVLCTSTSARFRLHERFFPCTYPDAEIQKRVAALIDLILEGGNGEEELEALLRESDAPAVVLGCTELSLIKLKNPTKKVIDPLKLTAIYLTETWKHNYDINI